MNIGAVYSNLNGVEFLMVHQPDLWGEVRDVISSVDAEDCRTKKSKEKRTEGKMLYSPIDMNASFKALLEPKGQGERRNTF